MEKWRGWLRFQRSLVFPTKCKLLKVTKHLRPKAEGKLRKKNLLDSISMLINVCVTELKGIMTGKREGLLGLYKDLEGCGEYEDIQVMWKMVLSSCPSTAHKTRRTKRPYSWRISFCIRPS